MKHAMKRLIALFLVAAALFGMAACKPNTPEEDPDDSTTETTVTEPVTKPLLTEGRAISDADGLTEYIILVPTSPSEPTVELEIATTLQELMWEEFGVRIRIAAATKRPTKLPEILIGETCRESMGDIDVDRSGLGSTGYYVRNYGEHIVFVANSDQALWNCMVDFMRNYMAYDPYTMSEPIKAESKQFFVPEDFCLEHKVEGTHDFADIKINGVDVTKFMIVGGENCGTSASALSSALQDLTNSTFNVIYADKSATQQDIEIVIGKSKRDGALFNVDYSQIKDGTCSVFYFNNRLVFAANSPIAYQYAVPQFLRDYFGYAQNEVYPSEPISLNFEEGLITTYTVDSNLNNVTVGTVDIDRVLGDSMQKLAGSGLSCYSDEKTIKKVMERTKTQAKYGDVNFSFSPDYGVCDCDACKQAAEEYGSPYGAYYKLVKDCAQQLLDSGSTSQIKISAITETYETPNIKFPSNVEVTVGNRRLCAKHSIGDSACETNAAFVKVLDEWAATGATVSVVDFTSDFAYYPAFFPNFRTTYQNIAFYSQKNVKNLYIHFNEGQASTEFGALRKQIYSYLSFHTSLSEDEYVTALKAAIGTVYGQEYSEKLYEYITLMEGAASSDCFSANDKPGKIIPISYTTDDAGKKTYDLSLAYQAYAVWNEIHPFYPALSDSDLLINQYLFNLYQASEVSHSYNSFTEWIQQSVDMLDYFRVMTSIVASKNN